MKSVISLVNSLVRSAHATSQSSGPLLVLRCEKVFIQFAHCYCFEAGLRSKRFRVVSEERATEERRVTGFSVWAARKMERAAIFFAVLSLIPRSLLWNRTETRVWYACFSSARRNGRFLSLSVAGSVSRNVATTGSGERRGCILLQGIHFSQPTKHIAARVTGVRCGDGAKRCDPKTQQNLPP